MKLKNLRITLSNIGRTTNCKGLEVISTSTVKKRNEANTGFTDEIEGYSIDCSAYRGDTIKIKFPVTVADKIENLKKLLDDDVTVEIGFIGLKLTPYAMIARDGSLLAGVSGKATDFEIIKEIRSDIEELDWVDED